MRAIWTERALVRLEEISDFIAEDSPQIVRSLIERIFSATEQLEESPNSGDAAPEKGDDSVRQLICEPYRIIYQVGEVVEILTVRHSRRLFDSQEVDGQS